MVRKNTSTQREADGAVIDPEDQLIGSSDEGFEATDEDLEDSDDTETDDDRAGSL